MWILRNIQEHLFYRTLLYECFWCVQPCERMHSSKIIFDTFEISTTAETRDLSWQPPEVSCKKTCSQNSQENTCIKVSFLIKLQACGLWPATLLKKRLWYRCFPVNFTEFLRIPFLQNISGWLLLSWLYWKKSELI